MTPRSLAGLLCIASVGLASCPEPIPVLVDRDTPPLTFGEPHADCAECHEQHVREWEISNHAYAAKDPVFLAMVELGQRATEGGLGQFCVQCHSPPGMATGQTAVEQDPETGVWTQNLLDLDPIAAQGVSCDVCHSMTDVVEPVNARAVYTPDGIRRATIEDPMENDAHASEYSELHASSELCGSCHAVTNPRGALIEETFPEWEASEAAAEGLQCQDCHMPEYSGQAAPDAPERTLHRHTFVGVDVSLLPEDEFPGYQEMRDLTAQLLQSSVEAEFAFDSQTRQLSSSIRNLAGHAVPSGATAERQMWLRTIVRDAQGSVVFASGTLDANGDIRDGISSHSLEPGTDPQLAYYGQLLVAVPGIQDLSGDELTQRQQEASAACLPLGRGGVMKDSGVHYVTFPWQADWQCNYMIPPDQVGEHSYDLSELAPGDYSATIELLFRTFPPYFLRLLEEETGLDPQVKERLPTVLMASDELSFSVD